MEAMSEDEFRSDERAALAFPIAFGCHHRHMSRVFTIKDRTYRCVSIVDMNSICVTFINHSGPALRDKAA
jgi:hypothetical protein